MHKKTFFLIILLFIQYNLFAQIELGIQASIGLNAVKINYRQYIGMGETYTSLPCYKAGIISQLPISEKVKLNSSIEYMDKRLKLHFGDLTEKYDILDYLYLRNQNNLERELGKNFFCSAGFTLNYLFLTQTQYPETKIYFTNKSNKFCISMGCSLGYKIKNSIRVVLDTEYDITPYFTITETNEHYKFRFYNINLGFQYYLKRK